MEGCTGDLEGRGGGVVRGEDTGAEGGEFEWFLDDDSFDRFSMIENLLTTEDFSPYRLCVGVVCFCGERLAFELGVEADRVFRLLLGVFGSSASLLGSHCRRQLLLRTTLTLHTSTASSSGFSSFRFLFLVAFV